MIKALLIFGTRPEAIKLAPLIPELRAQGSFRVQVCVTGQHRELLDQVLEVFEITPDYDLELMRPDQSLFNITAEGLRRLEPVLRRSAPDLVIVQGDASSAFVGALAAFYRKIPLAHVEAGLRTGDLWRPYPEEANRLLTDHLSRWCFAPSERARQNLLREGIPAQRIWVSGNTAIDALRWALGRVEQATVPDEPERRLILVTGHRRESFGPELEQICLALRDLSERNERLEIIYSVHPNPQVRGPARRLLSGLERVRLIEPPDYLAFVRLMNSAELILTDSGGIQEEAPFLGVPVLVLRHETERVEALDAGASQLVGTGREAIVRAAERLLNDPQLYRSMAQAPSPYGDGQAARRIARVLAGAF